MTKKHRRRFWLSVTMLLIYGIFAMFTGVITSDFGTPLFIVVLFGSTVLIGLPILIATLMGYVWRYELKPIDEDISNSTDNIGKQKRKAIDDVLQDLSDDDLMALRRRLQERSIDDEELYDQFVGDDGELVYRN